MIEWVLMALVFYFLELVLSVGSRYALVVRARSRCACFSLRLTEPESKPGSKQRFLKRFTSARISFRPIKVPEHLPSSQKANNSFPCG